MNTDDAAVQYAQATYPDTDIVVSLYGMNVVWTSQAFAEGLGYSVKELTGKSLRDIMVLTPEQIVAMSAEFIEGKTIKDDTRMLVRRDGDHVEDHADIYAYMTNGEPFIAVVGSSTAHPYQK